MGILLLFWLSRIVDIFFYALLIYFLGRKNRHNKKDEETQEEQELLSTKDTEKDDNGVCILKSYAKGRNKFSS